MKKTISLLLSMILVVALSLPAMASDLANPTNNISDIEHLLQSVERSVNGVNGSSLVLIGVDAVRDTLNGLNGGNSGGNSGGSGYTVKLMGNGEATITFSDVNESDWFYDTVMEMAKRGSINGYSDGTFKPADSMKRSEFIKVIIAEYYKNELDSMPEVVTPWYLNYYKIAVEHGIVEESEFSLTDMDQDCTRQEMAMFMVRALADATGEKATNLVDTSVMSDYSSIGTYYQGYVRQAYSLGLLAGRGEGKFAPKENMTRAEAATALYRLVDASTRVAVDTGTGTTTPGTGTSQAGQVNEWGNVILDTKPVPVGNLTTDNHGLSIDEGQTHGMFNWSTRQDFSRNNVKFNEGENHPVPIQGDIVVKADGTEVKIDFFYGDDGKLICLRAPGCDIWTGATFLSGGEYFTIGVNAFTGNFKGDGTNFKKGFNGEFFTGNMWKVLQTDAKRPSRQGAYDGEVVDLFIWSADLVTGQMVWNWYGG